MYKIVPDSRKFASQNGIICQKTGYLAIFLLRVYGALKKHQAIDKRIVLDQHCFPIFMYVGFLDQIRIIEPWQCIDAG